MAEVTDMDVIEVSSHSGNTVIVKAIPFHDLSLWWKVREITFYAPKKNAPRVGDTITAYVSVAQ